MEVFDKKLIKLVKMKKCLHNTRLRSKSKKLERTNAWKSISKQLQRPVEECIPRWKTLRDRFVREKRKYEQQTDSTEELERWDLYDEMRFISPFLQSSNTPKTFAVTCEKFLAPTMLSNDFCLTENLQNDSYTIEDSSSSLCTDRTIKRATSTMERFADLIDAKDFVVDLPEEDSLKDQIDNCIYPKSTSTLNGASGNTCPDEPAFSKRPRRATDSRIALSACSNETTQTMLHMTGSSIPNSKQRIGINDSKTAILGRMEDATRRINVTFATERDDNDLFLEFVGKKMKLLSEEAKLRVQGYLFANLTEELLKNK